MPFPSPVKRKNNDFNRFKSNLKFNDLIIRWILIRMTSSSCYDFMII